MSTVSVVSGFHCPSVFEAGLSYSDKSKLVYAFTVPKVTSRNPGHAAAAHWQWVLWHRLGSPAGRERSGGVAAQWPAYLWNSAEGPLPKGRAFSGAHVAFKALSLQAEETQVGDKRGEL